MYFIFLYRARCVLYTLHTVWSQKRHSPQNPRGNLVSILSLLLLFQTPRRTYMCVLCTTLLFSPYFGAEFPTGTSFFPSKFQIRVQNQSNSKNCQLYCMLRFGIRLIHIQWVLWWYYYKNSKVRVFFILFLSLLCGTGLTAYIRWHFF